jgi:hypothetical protein
MLHTFTPNMSDFLFRVSLACLADEIEVYIFTIHVVTHNIYSILRELFVLFSAA